MSGFLTIIIILAGVWFSGKISVWYDQWRLGKLKITFEDFLSYYAVNSNRFCLDDVLHTTINNQRVYFKFNFIDYMKYQRFLKNRQKSDIIRKDNELMAQFLELVMRDVQKKRELAATEQQKAIDDLLKRSNQSTSNWVGRSYESRKGATK